MAGRELVVLGGRGPCLLPGTPVLAFSTSSPPSLCSVPFILDASYFPKCAWCCHACACGPTGPARSSPARSPHDLFSGCLCSAICILFPLGVLWGISHTVWFASPPNCVPSS